MPSGPSDSNNRDLGKGLFVEAGFTVHTNGFTNFIGAIPQCLARVEVTGRWALGERKDGTGQGRSGHLATTWEKWQRQCLDHGLRRLKKEAHTRSERGHRVLLVGNGGSAAICSHMATDWTKNGGIRALSLNDGPLLTCLGNDFGFDQVFAKALEFYARPGDLVVIISTSGKSPNIVAAAEKANSMRLDTVRFSGMDPENRLRRGGMLHFYVPAGDYGLVELTHAILLHSVVSVSR